MEFVTLFAAFIDRLDPGITRFLDYFRDEHVPLRLSFSLVAAALLLLAVLALWSGAASLRLARLRRALRAFGRGADFARNFAAADATLAASIIGPAWRDYRPCLKPGPNNVLYPRRPDDYIGLHALRSVSFPAPFFAAAHGYFTGIGLLLTFVGLVAALKFAAAGVASPDLAIAKEALNALLSAASFKFMTSIAGLGCSLLLSVASRVATHAVDGAAQDLALELERAMAPLLSECVAYDQLAATREQLHELRQLNARLATTPITAATNSTPQPALSQPAGLDAESLKSILATVVAEMRRASGNEMKQVTGTLVEIGTAIGGMQQHIDRSGAAFADQLSLAGARLLQAATALQKSVDSRVDQVGDRIEALAQILAKSETLFAASAKEAAQGMVRSMKTAGDEIALSVAAASKGLVATSDDLAQRLHGMLGGFERFNQSLAQQMTSMEGVVASLANVKQVLDQSTDIWLRSAAPVTQSVDAARRVAAELAQVAGRVAASQGEMATMAQAMTQLAAKTSSVWDNYSRRFEKVDDDLQAVFERLQGGTRAFGKEVMEFVGELDNSLAEGMNALSAGTEELRKVAEMLVLDQRAKAA
jgi:hypothetical protein